MPDKHGSTWSSLRASYLSLGLITRLHASFILIVITHSHDSIIPLFLWHPSHPVLSIFLTLRPLYIIHTCRARIPPCFSRLYIPLSGRIATIHFGPTTNAYTFGCWSTSLDRVSIRLRAWRAPYLNDTLTTRDRLPSALWQSPDLGSSNPSFNTGRSYTYLT